jgi:hypothetical protein
MLARSSNVAFRRIWHHACFTVVRCSEDKMTQFRTLLALAVVSTTVALSTGCAQVAPYERAKLAHPTMAAADLAGPGESHLRAITEGAIGGSEGAGSGCGCN